MHDLNITVARFGPYPTDEPVSYVVGFAATHTPTGRSMYRDCTVPFEDLASAHTDDDVLAAAWNGVRESFEAWCGACGAKSRVIGSTFTPASDPLPESEPVVDPSVDPSVDLSVDPSVEPSVEPVIEPSVEPSVEP